MPARRRATLITVCASLIVSMTLLGSAGGVGPAPRAQSAVAPRLFLLAVAAAKDLTGGTAQVGADRALVRARAVTLNFEPLRAADVPAGVQPAASTIELNLFDDVTLLAVLDRVDQFEGGFTWVGHVADAPMSSATFAVVDGVVAGSIVTTGAVFSVQYVGGGLHEVRQVDQSKYLRDLEPRTPAAHGTATALPAAADAPAASADDGSTIDVMVLYTLAAQTAAGGPNGIAARINLGISETNISYANSGVTQRLRLVKTAAVDYVENKNLDVDLTAVTTATTPLGTVAATLRNAYAADLVMLITAPATPNACGVGWHMTTVDTGFESNGFSVVEQSCISPSFSFAHELGHNMGATHDWYVDNGILPHTYAHGYADTTGRYTTIMAYDDACTAAGVTCARVLYWSNPSKTSAAAYGSRPMGIAGGTKSNCPTKNLANMACDADDHRTLNETAATVANFRSSASAVVPMITTDPSSQTVAIGATASFTAASGGTPTPTVQWQVSTDGGTTWANISGATSPTYSFTVALGDHLKQFRAVFTNPNAAATTKAATLTVLGAPLVASGPASLTVGSGATATFTVTASGTPTPAVQWQVSTDGGITWTNVSGATSATYSFAAGSTDHLKQFRAVLTNSQGTLTSSSATLALLNGPVVIVQPASAATVAGSSVSIQAMASGTPAPTVQWQISGDSGSTWTDVTGATSRSLRVTPSVGDPDRLYRAVFTNSVATAATRSATVGVRTPAAGFFRSMQYPAGGRIRAIAIDPGQPQLIYVAAWSGGVYRSVDGGASWLNVMTRKGKFDVETLAIDPQDARIVYAGTTAGLYKSLDRGTTWSLSATGLNILALAVDPHDSQVLYAGTNGSGAWKSTDGGLSWTTMLSGQIDPFVPAVGVDPRNSSALYFGTDKTLWATSDGGASWAEWPMVARAIAFDRTTAGLMYVVGDGTYKSTDAGASFTQMSPGVGDSLYLLSVVIDPAVSETVYVGSYTGFWKSTNSGQTWTAFALPQSWGIRAAAAGPSGSGVLYAGTNGAGIMKSSDGGATWAPSNAGMAAGGIHALSVDPRDARKTLAASGTSAFCGIELWGTGGNGLWRTTDGGSTWSVLTSGVTATTFTALARDPANPDVVYAGGNGASGAVVLRSADNGVTWTSVSTGLPGHGVMALVIDSRTSGTLYAATYGSGVYKTTNSGASWTAVNTGLTNLSVQSIGADPLAASTFYAGTAGDGVFKTTDGGAHWTKMGTGARTVLGFAFDPANAGVLFAAGWVDGIYKSADGGTTWVAATASPTSVTAVSIDPTNAQTFYATSYDDGLFKSIDAGVTWAAVDVDVQPVTALSIGLPSTSTAWLYVGTENAGVLVNGTATQLHPADSNGDGRLVISEITAYGAAWKRGDTWPVGPNPIPISYVTRAGFLWRNGESYQFGTGACPACWAPPSADVRMPASDVRTPASVWNVSFDRR